LSYNKAGAVQMYVFSENWERTCLILLPERELPLVRLWIPASEVLKMGNEVVFR